MNKKFKITLGVSAFVIFAGLLSSCNSFCSNLDNTQFLYANDPLNNYYFNSQEDAYEFVEYTFKQQKNYNKKDGEYTYSTNDLYYIADDGEEKKVIENESDVFKTYGNLTYVRPASYILKGASKVEDKEGNKEDISYTFGLNSFIKSINTTASSQGIILPSYTYFEKADLLMLDTVLANVNKYNEFNLNDSINESYIAGLTKETLKFEDLYGYTFKELMNYKEDGKNLDILLGNEADTNGRTSIDGTNTAINVGGRNYSLITNLGYLKFYNEESEKEYFSNVKEVNKKLGNELGLSMVMSDNYFTLYENTLKNKIANIKTCITVDQGYFNHVGSDDLLFDSVRIEAKGSDFWGDWGKAFSKHGFLEGLLVYPISYLVDTFAHSFGMNGWGQIWAVLLVTIIVRLLFMAITLPSTISQQKQQALQPELAKLQQKYPNSNTNDYEKQRLAQAQMALYKKHKIHPFLSMLTLIIQFPLFISVWNALAGTASLSNDAVLGLRLSDTIWNVLSNFSGWPGNGGWWTALVLIILMSVGQVMSMLVPQLLNKKKMKSIQKTTKNPTADQQSKVMKWVQWGMIIFTIILGFTLPSAMGVYWLAGSIFNIVQSIIMHFIFTRKKKEK